MKFWKDTNGSSLVEVMAAAVVLSILMLITAKGFYMSARIMERGRVLKLETSSSVLSAETGEVPDEEENGELIFDSLGREYRIPVTIKRYGTIWLLSEDEDSGDQLQAGLRGNDELQDDR